MDIDPDDVAFVIGIGDPVKRHELMQSKKPWLLTNYESFSIMRKDANGHMVNRYPEMTTQKWGAVAFDEGHRLRGRNTHWTKEVLKLQTQAGPWTITGSPIVRSPEDVFPPLKLFDKAKHRSFWRWIDEYCTTVTTPWATEVTGVKNVAVFNEMLVEYRLRRFASQIPELAKLEHVDHIIEFDVPPSIKVAHDKAKKDYIIEHPDLDDKLALDSAGALVHWLRSFTGAPPGDNNEKAKIAVDIIRHSIGPVVCFAWYHASVDQLKMKVQKAFASRQIWSVTGDDRADTRHKVMQAHQASSDGILIATLGSIKEGVNLQVGNVVIFYECDYLPGINDQALKRVKRRGQERVVQAYWLLARNVTIDRAVYRVQKKREGMIESLDKPLREVVREVYAE